MTLEIVVVNRDTGQIESSPKVPVSAPSPHIILDYAALTLAPSQPANPDPGFKGELHISGRVICGVCDTTPGTDGTIDEVKFFQNYENHLYDIPITVIKGESENPGRPYPYEGTFNVLLPLTTLDSGSNLFLLRAHDKVLGRTGDLEFFFKITVASSNLDNQPKDVQEDPNVPWIIELAATRGDWRKGSRDDYFHPLLCRVALESGSSAGVVVQTLAGPRRTVAGPDGELYLADANGTKPEVLLLLAGDIEPPFMKNKSAQSPFRGLDSQAPHKACPQQDWFRLGFRHGFLDGGLSLMAGRETLATLALRQNVVFPVSNSLLQMTWNWGKKTRPAGQAMQSQYAVPSLPWLDRIADVVFRCLVPNNASDDLVVTFLSGDWETVQMEGFPEEQRHLLEMTTEYFEELAVEHASSHSGEVGRNFGASFREMLNLMAPLCDPATTAERSLISKLDFLKLYGSALKMGPKSPGGWFSKFF